MELRLQVVDMILIVSLQEPTGYSKSLDHSFQPSQRFIHLSTHAILNQARKHDNIPTFSPSVHQFPLFTWVRIDCLPQLL